MVAATKAKKSAKKIASQAAKPRRPAAPTTGKFSLAADFAPAGDQPQAIARLLAGIKKRMKRQTLLGVTGSGKTFTMAQIVARQNRPTMVLAHNKTLAAQLYAEFRGFFPENAVEYFVSYYDYYQPEAYVPARDLFIEKDSSVNEHIEQMRLSATKALMERRDCLIVATVSAIYGIGDPVDYHSMVLHLQSGEKIARDAIIRRLAAMQYERSQFDFKRGTFRVRGDTVDVFPAENSERALRIDLGEDDCARLSLFDPLTGGSHTRAPRFTIYPSSHYVAPRDTVLKAMTKIRAELKIRLPELERAGKIVEAQRLGERTRFDLEMIESVGFCKGIENYSRHLSGREAGEPPPTLFDYLPGDALLFIDESHATVPQLGGMFRGDRSRKQTLVDFGFRLPSALDNRPLQFEEFERLMPQMICVSATPGPYEREKSEQIVEQVVRPTGLVDPPLIVRPAKTQVDDALFEIRECAKRGERALVTTLTKRMAEQLTQFLNENGARARYLHSDIDTVERADILRDLRRGEFDALVGINLLREGLDLPEVSLVAIFDADKEGFLRSEQSLIQTVGRAARNINGRAVLYADSETNSMRRAIAETQRRRQAQEKFNRENGITPRGIQKAVTRLLEVADDASVEEEAEAKRGRARDWRRMNEKALGRELRTLEKRMLTHARNLEFEQAADLRDQIRKIRELVFAKTNPDAAVAPK